MFKFLVLATALLGVTAAATDGEWAVFKAKHGKTFHQEENTLRRMIYEDNLKKIKEHNELFAKGLETFYLEENEYADMTNAEFVKVMNSYRSNGVNRARGGQTFKLGNVSLPAKVDWRTKGYVTEVKNQGQCGSCWAFSSTGSLEGAHYKATGKLVSLSEKNLMDCSKSYGNQGCNGGIMDAAFKYIIHNKGIDTEESYPYVPRDSPTCKFNPKTVGATMSSYVDIQSGSELKLQQAVATVGPVSVAIDASHFSFQFYRGGVYNALLCSSLRVDLDHGVLTVGYGVENGIDYWLVKNSWGTGWGLHGYIKMSRNRNNQCGIATDASYPVV